jgi:fibronectin-binding autotransporter adhesin
MYKYVTGVVITLLGSLSLFLIGLDIAQTPKVDAATKTWNGSSDLNWTTANNWTPSGIPQPGDDVIIPDQGSAYTINKISTNEYNSVDVGENVTIATSGGGNVHAQTYTMGANSSITGTTLVSAGGSVTLQGDVAFENFGAADDVTISGSHFLEIQNMDAYTVVVNDTNIFQSGTGNIYLEVTLNDADYTCQVSGCWDDANPITLNLNDGSQMSFAPGNVDTNPDIVSNGATTMLGRTGSNTAFSGDIAIQSGTLTIGGNELVPRTYTADRSFTVSGVISGAGNLVTRDVVTLTGNNTYTGTTTVNNGGVVVDHINALGSDGAGEGTTVQENGSIVFNNNSDIIITEIFDVDAVSVSPGTSAFINLNASGRPELKQTTTFAGNRLVGGSSLGEIKFNGPVVVTSGTLTVEVPDNAQSSFDTTVSGAGNLTKEGDGTLEIFGDNTYTGVTTINNGGIIAHHEDALGDTAANTVINDGGSLVIDDVELNEALVATGAGEDDLGAIIGNSTASTLNSITVSGTTVISGFSVSDDGLSTNQLNGSGTVYFDGPGLVAMGLDVGIPGFDNTFNGKIVVREGSGIFAKQSGQDNFFGEVEVQDGANLILFTSDQIVDSVSIQVDGLLTAGGFGAIDETFNALNGGSTGGIRFLDDSTLGLGAGNGDGDFAGDIEFGENNIITKSGTGTQVLSGDAVVGGSGYGITLTQGSLAIDGDFGDVPITQTGGMLMGTGTTGDLDADNGSVKPGRSPGILTINGDADFDSGSNISVDLDGSTQGTEYDLLNITGNLDLGDVNLVVDPGYVPTIGQVFSIVEVGGTLNGTFNDLADGATVSGQSGGFRYDYQINYLSNSITLTFLGTTELEFSETGDRVPYTLVYAFGLLSIASIAYGIKTYTSTKH